MNTPRHAPKPCPPGQQPPLVRLRLTTEPHGLHGSWAAAESSENLAALFFHDGLVFLKAPGREGIETENL